MRVSVFSTGDFDDGQLSADDTVAAAFRILQECSVKIVGKREKDALRKIFIDPDVVNSFSEAAVSLMRKLRNILTSTTWDEWVKNSTKVQPTVSGKEIDQLQSLFSLNSAPAESTTSFAPTSSKSNKILDSIKESFAAEPAVEAKPSTNGTSKTSERSDNYSRSQNSSGQTSDLARLLIKEQFVSTDGSSTTIEDFIPVIESLLTGDAPEESVQSEVSKRTEYNVLWYDLMRLG